MWCHGPQSRTRKAAVSGLIRLHGPGAHRQWPLAMLSSLALTGHGITSTAASSAADDGCASAASPMSMTEETEPHSKHRHNSLSSSGSSSSSSTTTGAGAAAPSAPPPRRISRVPTEKLATLFTPSQRQRFPRGYLPASGVAHFLRPEGVPLGDVLECYQELVQHVQQHRKATELGMRRGSRATGSPPEDEGSEAVELRQDFASDYILWSRCTIEDFVEDHLVRSITVGAPARRLCARRMKWFRQWSSRQVLLSDAVVRELFLLSPHLPSPPPSRSFTAEKEPNHPRTPSDPAPRATKRGEFYEFTPHAALQHLALRPLEGCRGLQDLVHFQTFPQIHNLFRQEWDSMSPLRALCHYTGEQLVYTQEFILALASYLRQALEDISQKEPALAGPHYQPTSPAAVADAPIVCFFGDGRLAHELHATGLLPRRVVAVRLARQRVAAQKARRLAVQEMQRGTSVLPKGEHFRDAVHPNFSEAAFPCEEVRSVGEALRQYQPVLTVVEPHRGGRDYLADIRGYFTMRRVVVLGALDGPGMGSTWFPYLSFGVTPGPTTYFVFNDHLQQVHAASRIQMPMDPPHEQQGYRKVYLDTELSHWMLSPNEVAALPHQYRAMVFERVTYPLRRAQRESALSSSSSTTLLTPKDTPK